MGFYIVVGAIIYALVILFLFALCNAARRGDEQMERNAKLMIKRQQEKARVIRLSDFRS